MKSEHLIKLATVLGECGYEITGIESEYWGPNEPITSYQISIGLVVASTTGSGLCMIGRARGAGTDRSVKGGPT
jgi:hypothetical protein